MEVYGADGTGILISFPLPTSRVPLPASRWHPTCTGSSRRFERKAATRRERSSRALPALLIAGTLVVSACAGMSQKQKGAVVGAATGAAVGGVIGNQTGSTARGAIIGAIVGGTAGAVIGHQMDQQAKELQQNIPGATIQRVGEGIAVTFASGILFPFNSTEILPAGEENLTPLAHKLAKNPHSDVRSEKHTSEIHG